MPDRSRISQSIFWLCLLLSRATLPNTIDNQTNLLYSNDQKFRAAQGIGTCELQWQIVGDEACYHSKS